MKVQLNLGSYITKEYPKNQKKVQLLSNRRIYTTEEIDKYFSDVIDGYNKQNETNSVKKSILNIKDKICQIMKRK